VTNIVTPYISLSTSPELEQDGFLPEERKKKNSSSSSLDIDGAWVTMKRGQDME
jgi:hypothetical protein